MTYFERINDGLPVVLLFIMMLLLQGCVSVQLPSTGGKPTLVGFGRARPMAGTNGQIYQIVAPGLSFRFHSYAPGVSLGWNETRLFFPLAATEADTIGEPVAIQTRCLGFNLAPGQVMVGYDRVFRIPMPTGANIVQMISYSAENPTNTIVQRKELSR